MAVALASLHKEQKRLRTDHAATQAEHSARQDAVAALLADVTTMRTKSPEEQEALVARIAASMTSSAGAEAEEEEEKEGWGEETRSELICDDEERRRYAFSVDEYVYSYNTRLTRVHADLIRLHRCGTL